jgi:hypothetical protein
MKEFQLKRDEHAAATELGYVFTFLLGVMLLTIFSVWAWDIETVTRTRWNENAIEANMDDIAAAIERADEASRIEGASYAESVEWRNSEADESRFKLVLNDFKITLVDEGGTLDTSVVISGTGSGSHEGEINLGGADKVWVVHDNGITTIQLDRPQS